MKQLQIYDFNLAAGASMNLPVQGSYVRILTATGNINIIADTFGKLGPVSRGQGLQNSVYNRLTIQDASGAPNVGQILVSEADFIDQTTYGSFSIANAVALDAATLAALEQINVRPEAQSGFYSDASSITANTPLTIFAPGSNVNGAILLSATMTNIYATAAMEVFITKASAPTSITDGAVVLQGMLSANGSSEYVSANLPKEQFIAAGQGLYFISNVVNTAGGVTLRTARYKLL